MSVAGRRPSRLAAVVLAPVLVLVSVLFGARRALGVIAEPAAAGDAGSAVARSGDEVVYETEVRSRHRDDDDQREAQRALDTQHAGFATAVVLGDEASARSAQGLPEVLARVPAATVRSLGGLGQFSSVSLRGSSGQQVGVFLDGVPLSSSMAGLADLGDLPLEAFGALEIYRGYVPVEFGSAAIGGVVQLVAPSMAASEPLRLRLRSGIGSFGAREIGVDAAWPTAAAGAWQATFGYASARGDYPFLFDNNTPQFAADDVTARRVRNGYGRLFAQLRRDARAGAWRYGVRQLVLVKQQQIPAPASVQQLRRDLGTLQLRSLAHGKRAGVLLPAGVFAWVTGLGVEQRHFVDRGEPAVDWLRTDERTRSADLYVSPRLRLPLWDGAFLSLCADGRYEWVSVDNAKPSPEPSPEPSPTAMATPASATADPDATSGDATRQRLAGGAGVELAQHAWNGRLMLTPVLRADAIDSRFGVPAGAGERHDAGRDSRRIDVSPRLAARLRVAPQLELRASAGRYQRPPTLMELFGDRGYIKGDEGLQPETATALDAGWTAQVGERRVVAARMQAAAYVTRSQNLIQWFHAGERVRPQNVEGALLRGVELALDASAWNDTLRATGNYTFLDARDRSDSDASLRDKTLPGRPRHELFARLEVAQAWPAASVATIDTRLWVTSEYVAGTFLDARERLSLPPRLLHGAGVQATWNERVRVAFEARNLFDVRETQWRPPYASARPIPTAISDFIGFPLPGRSLWLTLEVQWEALRGSVQGAT